MPLIEKARVVAAGVSAPPACDWNGRKMIMRIMAQGRFFRLKYVMQSDLAMSVLSVRSRGLQREEMHTQQRFPEVLPI